MKQRIVFISGLVALVLCIIWIFIMFLPKQEQEMVGATLPIAGVTYSLAGSGTTASATSITLSSLTIPQTGYELVDSDFSDTFYVTLEPGNPKRQEIISCTTVVQNANNSATLSGCSRGLTPFTPFTASTTYAFSHGGGTSVIFSDPPQLFNEFTAKSNAETITRLWTFNIHPTALSSLGVPTSTYQYVTKQYVDVVALQGAATSTEDTGGISELATQIEMASTTDLGPTRPLVLQAKYATSTCQVAGLYIPITQNDGKISNVCLDLTETYTWTGSHTFSASSTFSSATTTIKGLVLNGASHQWNGLSVKLPSVQGTSSTLLVNDGNGNLLWDNPEWDELAVTSTPIATSSFNITIPARKNIKIYADIPSSGADNLAIHFNRDATSNYSFRVFYDITSQVENGLSVSYLFLESSIKTTTTGRYFEIDVNNKSDRAKLVKSNSVSGSSLPVTAFGKWNNTSVQITEVNLYTYTGQTMAAGTEIRIYGSRD